MVPEPELLAACRALFGPEIDLNRDFLNYLQPGGAKAAFRVMAKKTHPDLARGNGGSEEFRRLVDAYALLRRFLELREAGSAAPAPRPTPHRTGSDYYYQGELPKRRLEIGRYLFYRGTIPYRSLIEAVSWQRRQRPPIGVLARRWNWLSDAAVQTVLYCGTRRGRFGEKALGMGLLSRFQVRQLLLHQRSLQAKFGEYFVTKGFLTPAQLDEMLREQQEHNSRYLAR